MAKKFILFLFFTHFFIFSGQADDKSLYDFKWLDDGEKVYVIQNKEHVKAKGIGVDFSVIDSNSSPYQETSGYMLAMTYYFSETWSIDFTYKQYNNVNSADFENLLKAYTTSVKPLVRKVDTAKLLHINWIPFYGKINTFNSIFYFDWGLGLGIGSFDTQGNNKTFNIANQAIQFDKSVDSGFNFRSFMKFFTKFGLTVGFEYNLTGVNTIKSSDQQKKYLYFNDIIGTVGFIF